ncbi:MAG: Na+/H+ antiporter NhaC family protein, partial [Flavobacteriales bacterium]
RMPALPALLIASVLGGLFALIYQPEVVASIGGSADSYFERSYRAIITSMAMETSVTTGNAMADDLLSAGGMSGMLNTIWLILCALTFGGVMQAVGLLRRITDGLLSMVNSNGSLIATTAGTSVFFNLTASDQYIAIVVPGKMYKDAFKEYDLAPENLSRTLEDAGTVTSVLIPWNTCGVAQSGVLSVSVLAFAPYCIFNWVSPLMTILFGYMGWKVTPLNAKKKEV